MREAAWNASQHPSRMLNELRVRRPSEARKLRLLAVACCRRIGDLLDDGARRAIDALERYADGLLTEPEMAAVAREALIASWDHAASGDPAEGPWASHAADAVADALAWEDEQQRRRQGPVINLIARVSGSAYHAAYARAAARFPGERDQGWQGAIRAEESAQANLVREIFGNVCQPIPFDPSWRTPVILDLARAIERSADFDGLPALGDALEEAGCDRVEILDHCRTPGDHVRGCWALDAVIERG
jgi:hypothetical protein